MIVHEYSCPRCRSRWPGLVRIVGHLSIWLAVGVVAYRIGVETALYWGSPRDLLEAARLRAGYYLGTEP